MSGAKNDCHQIFFIIVRCKDNTGYTNVLKIDLKCPEKYIKAYIFFLLSNGLSSNLEMLLILAYI